MGLFVRVIARLGARRHLFGERPKTLICIVQLSPTREPTIFVPPHCNNENIPLDIIFTVDSSSSSSLNPSKFKLVLSWISHIISSSIFPQYTDYQIGVIRVAQWAVNTLTLQNSNKYGPNPHSFSFLFQFN